MTIPRYGSGSFRIVGPLPDILPSNATPGIHFYQSFEAACASEDRNEVLDHFCPQTADFVPKELRHFMQHNVDHLTDPVRGPLSKRPEVVQLLDFEDENDSTKRTLYVERKLIKVFGNEPEVEHVEFQMFRMELQKITDPAELAEWWFLSQLKYHTNICDGSCLDGNTEALEVTQKLLQQERQHITLLQIQLQKVSASKRLAESVQEKPPDYQTATGIDDLDHKVAENGPMNKAVEELAVQENKTDNQTTTGTEGLDHKVAENCPMEEAVEELAFQENKTDNKTTTGTEGLDHKVAENGPRKEALEDPAAQEGKPDNEASTGTDGPDHNAAENGTIKEAMEGPAAQEGKPDNETSTGIDGLEHHKVAENGPRKEALEDPAAQEGKPDNETSTGTDGPDHSAEENGTIKEEMEDLAGRPTEALKSDPMEPAEKQENSKEYYFEFTKFVAALQNANNSGEFQVVDFENKPLEFFETDKRASQFDDLSRPQSEESQKSNLSLLVDSGAACDVIDQETGSQLSFLLGVPISGRDILLKGLVLEGRHFHRYLPFRISNLNTYKALMESYIDTVADTAAEETEEQERDRANNKCTKAGIAGEQTDQTRENRKERLRREKRERRALERQLKGELEARIETSDENASNAKGGREKDGTFKTSTRDDVIEEISNRIELKIKLDDEISDGNGNADRTLNTQSENSTGNSAQEREGTHVQDPPTGTREELAWESDQMLPLGESIRRLTKQPFATIPKLKIDRVDRVSLVNYLAIKLYRRDERVKELCDKTLSPGERLGKLCELFDQMRLESDLIDQLLNELIGRSKASVEHWNRLPVVPSSFANKTDESTQESSRAITVPGSLLNFESAVISELRDSNYWGNLSLATELYRRGDAIMKANFSGSGSEEKYNKICKRLAEIKSTNPRYFEELVEDTVKINKAGRLQIEVRDKPVSGELRKDYEGSNGRSADQSTHEKKSDKPVTAPKPGESIKTGSVKLGNKPQEREPEGYKEKLARKRNQIQQKNRALEEKGVLENFRFGSQEPIEESEEESAPSALINSKGKGKAKMVSTDTPPKTVVKASGKKETKDSDSAEIPVGVALPGKQGVKVPVKEPLADQEAQEEVHKSTEESDDEPNEKSTLNPPRPLSKAQRRALKKQERKQERIERARLRKGFEGTNKQVVSRADKSKSANDSSTDEKPAEEPIEREDQEPIEESTKVPIEGPSEKHPNNSEQERPKHEENSDCEDSTQTAPSSCGSCTGLNGTYEDQSTSGSEPAEEQPGGHFQTPTAHPIQVSPFEEPVEVPLENPVESPVKEPVEESLEVPTEDPEVGTIEEHSNDGEEESPTQEDDFNQKGPVQTASGLSQWPEQVLQTYQDYFPGLQNYPTNYPFRRVYSSRRDRKRLDSRYVQAAAVTDPNLFLGLTYSRDAVYRNARRTLVFGDHPPWSDYEFPEYTQRELDFDLEKWREWRIRNGIPEPEEQ